MEADSPRAKTPRQHALAIMGWTTAAMPHRYTSWMENESEEALVGVWGAPALASVNRETDLRRAIRDLHGYTSGPKAT